MPSRQLNVTLPGGFTVPVPRWVVPFFGVIAVIGISGGVYRHFYPVEPELVTVKQALAQLRLEIEHYNLHIMDAPLMAWADSSGAFGVRMFVDGCLLVSRKAGEKSSTRLLVDPVAVTSETRLGAWFDTPVLAQGRCLNPHPGKFQWRYGERVDQCWVQVWRQFDDTCEHVQLFNSCAGTWATNPDGSPQVRWTRCLH